MKGFTSAIPTRTFALSLAVSIVLSTMAWNPPPTGGMVQQNTSALMTKAAPCSPASSITQMSFNNVRAVIENGGNMWTQRALGRSGYEVPKTADFTGAKAIYAGALWMGGISSAGQLKIAAVAYRAGGNDFWPGPLTNDGLASVTTEVCSQYDRFYQTSRAQAEEHIKWYNCTQDPNCDLSEIFPNGYSVPPAFAQWPANGDPNAGQDLYLAPFIDVDGDAFYDPFSGDYPDYGFNTTAEECKNKNREDPVSLFGDDNIYWIFNDRGDIHTETNGEPIGLEVRAQSFSFNSNDEINNMTFLNYTVINQGSQTLTNTYFGHFVDADLGCPDDDFVGCDVQRGLGFCYNWQDNDATCNPGGGAAIGYGTQPPAIGVDFFEGPYQDADGMDNPGPLNNVDVLECSIARDQHGIPYKGLGIGYGDSIADNERFGMRAFIYFNRSGNSNLTDPSNPAHWYNYLRSIWKNGRPQSYGGNGYSEDPGAIRCFYMFPWNSDIVGWGTDCAPQPEWKEIQPTPSLPDRRFVQSAGPFTLEPGAYNNVTVGVVYARASSGGAAASIGPLRVADDKAQALFDNCFKILDGPDAPDLRIQELDRELVLYLVNPAGSNNEGENYAELDPVIPELGPVGQEYDREYKFQGYKVYQLRNSTVRVNDLDNVDLARLVYQGDVEDGVGQMINFEYDQSLMLTVPREQVNGANAGVVHALRITDDKFASGDPKLVNFKTYYYLAIAYGYNNYETYNLSAGTGQAKPYVAGRKAAFGSIRPYSGIPHKPKPELGGTVQNSNFGDLLPITRLEGQGNGGLRLELEGSTLDAILSGSPWRQDELNYKPGAGPITVRVVDPLAVPAAEFEVWFQDSITPGDLDDAYWFILNKTTQDTVFSDRLIDLNYEQLLLDWGISVHLGQAKYFFTAQGNEFRSTNKIGEGTIKFADPNKAWFTGIPDSEGANPSNWIRSGNSEDADQPLYDDRLRKDSLQQYEKILNGTWAPWSLVGEAPFQPSNSQQKTLTQSTRAPISETPSVQIVITKDQSKWTRALVLEQEESTSLALGGAPKLSLRRSPSIDKNGRMSGTPNCNEQEATLGGTQPTGAGWFPGYVVDLETGERLNMAYGENSFWGGAIGKDMIWNPSSVITTNDATVFGGSHWVYVFKNDRRIANDATRVPSYDEANYMYGLAVNGQVQSLQRLFRAVAWVGSALTAPGQEFLGTDVTITLNVKKPYLPYVGNAGTNVDPQLNGGLPLYKFGTGNYAVSINDATTANEALDNIDVVPNPYYGFSGYETTRLDNRVKFINLPQTCTISIYNVSGTLVRKFRKDNDLTYLDWDLKNGTNIPIAGGVYICHVEVPDVGEVVLKWFGALRPLDLQNF